MNTKYTFKYKNKALFKYPLILFIIVYIIGSILINRYILINSNKLIFMLLYLLILILWMLQIKKSLDITYGEFVFNQDVLCYTTLN